jgi:hypothetical protein
MVKIKIVEPLPEHEINLVEIGFNIIYLLTIINIFYNIDYQCYKCRSYNLMNAFKCDTCNLKFSDDINYKIIDKTRLSLIKYPLFLDDKDPEKQKHIISMIIYGNFSIPAYNGVNCQVFGNLLLNLLKGNPTNFKKGTKTYYTISKRILMIRYLIDINTQFLLQRFLTNDLEELFRLVNRRLSIYINNFVLDRFLEEGKKTVTNLNNERISKTTMLRLFKQANERIPKLLRLNNTDELPLESEDFSYNEDVYSLEKPPSHIKVYSGYDKEDED